MCVVIIAAISENNVIGLENKIPWYIKEDMKRFRDLTLNHSVIMGRKTYDSLPQKVKPLPQRRNIVLSRTLKESEGIYVAKSVEEALRLSEGERYVIGGRKVYEVFLPLAERMELTRVHQDFVGDAFFPEVRWDDWNLVSKTKCLGKESIFYSFLSYSRVKKY